MKNLREGRSLPIFTTVILSIRLAARLNEVLRQRKGIATSSTEIVVASAAAKAIATEATTTKATAAEPSAAKAAATELGLGEAEPGIGKEGNEKSGTVDVHDC